MKTRLAAQNRWGVCECFLMTSLCSTKSWALAGPKSNSDPELRWAGSETRPAERVRDEPKVEKFGDLGNAKSQLVVLNSEAELQLGSQHNLLAIFTVLRDAGHVGEKQDIRLVNGEIEVGRPFEIVTVHVVVDSQGQHTGV